MHMHRPVATARAVAARDLTPRPPAHVRCSAHLLGRLAFLEHAADQQGSPRRR